MPRNRMFGTEKVSVYCPKGLKGQLLELVRKDGGTLSGYVLSLIREAVRTDKRFNAEK
ncbi:MAG TPA: hypothetical protein VKW04_18250 [Planctomycetota bacterium]|nr:hypothetical protein [Planctomycetota bacterium]